LIQLNQIGKTYLMGSTRVEALKGIDLHIKQEEFVSIMGPSGSGKSTLMNIIGALDRPSSGEYLLEGQQVGDMTDNELSIIRNKKIGFVFQTFNLLPRKTAFQNVELPLIYAGMNRKDRLLQVEETLTMVGLQDRMKHKPNELSGGQRQRVAIARALINRPSLIFADEPTGNLDSKTGEEIMDIFRDLNKSQKVTVLLVTHEPEVAHQARRIIHIRDGEIASDTGGQ